MLLSKESPGPSPQETINGTRAAGSEQVMSKRFCGQVQTLIIFTMPVFCVPFVWLESARENRRLLRQNQDGNPHKEHKTVIRIFIFGDGN